MKDPLLLWKRLLDLVVSITGLIVLGPLIACLAVMIRLDSPGPAFFGQRRIGRLGVPFTLWKFRSMYHRSSQALHQQASLNWFTDQRQGHRYKDEADPRITALGRFLRRTNLDELPQLFNVLKGEMSLVGPRPVMEYERSFFESWHYEREKVRPGITGLWQVSDRFRLSARQMIALDVRYVRECSFRNDVKILALTVLAVLGALRHQPGAWTLPPS